MSMEQTFQAWHKRSRALTALDWAEPAFIGYIKFSEIVRCLGFGA